MLATSSSPTMGRRAARIVAAHVAGEPAPGDAPDLRADRLDRAHQRIGEQQGPTQRSRTARRPGNRWRCRWVVVGRARNQARPHDVGELRPPGCLTWLGDERMTSMKLSPASARGNLKSNFGGATLFLPRGLRPSWGTSRKGATRSGESTPQGPWRARSPCRRLRGEAPVLSNAVVPYANCGGRAATGCAHSVRRFYDDGVATRRFHTSNE